jgi:hypothetical protein
MFYTSSKRHIGGEGRANETGIPPASGQKPSAPPSFDIKEAWQRQMHDLGSAPALPARPQTVTPGSSADPIRKWMIALETFDAKGQTTCVRPGRSHTQIDPTGRS